jgi:lipoate-protein ligase A
MTDWWLIDDPPAGAARNMAKDAYLFTRIARWNRPILRLYEWDAPTLSLGRNQRIDGAVDAGACAREGVSLVRRMTGGWAVLHGADLTYSVTAPVTADGRGPFGDSILSTYRAIAEVFLRLFRELGYAPEMQPYSGRERAGLASPICFQTPSACELLIGGKKLVGSAQRRRPDAFLQHGSIPAAPQQELLARLFVEGDDGAMRDAMTDLATLGLWRRFTPSEFRARLIEAFADVFGANRAALPWGQREEEEVAVLESRFPPIVSARDAPGAVCVQEQSAFSSGVPADRPLATSGRFRRTDSSGE